jgi:hypothetical protein
VRLLFGVSLGAGVVALLVVLTAGRAERLRLPSAIATAFGIAGLSAAYAGWPTPLVLAAAVVAAAVFGWYAGLERP